MIVWGRYQFRIKTVYGGTDDAFAEVFEKATTKHEQNRFFNTWASHSYLKYVDRLTKNERDKFWKLYEDAVPVDTFVPGLGYKVKHRFSDDLVYVLDMGAYGNRTKRRDIDPSRERLRIAKRDAYMWQVHTVNLANNAQYYMSSLAYRANEVYVDRLTKKQKEALMFIRMMAPDTFVEGLGGKVERYGQSLEYVYILDC